MKGQLPFSIYFALISLVAAYLIWPAHNSARDFPLWLALFEAAAGGFAAAYVVASVFGTPTISTVLGAFAGILAIVLALLFTCYITAWTFYIAFQDELGVPAPNPITTPGIAFVVWVIYFVLKATEVPEIALVDFAAIAGAMSLVRHPLARWATWGCALAIAPLSGLLIYRSLQRTVDLAGYGIEPVTFWPIFMLEAAMVVAAIGVCWWVSRLVAANAKAAEPHAACGRQTSPE